MTRKEVREMSTAMIQIVRRDEHYLFYQTLIILSKQGFDLMYPFMRFMIISFPIIIDIKEHLLLLGSI